MTKIPKNFQDYDEDDPHIDKRLSRWKYWNNLKILMREFKEETGSNDHREYLDWLENKYGFLPVQTIDGMMTDNYKVVDEKLFLVYILKYGK